MSRRVAIIPKDFCGFPTAPIFSVQHECDMGGMQFVLGSPLESG